MNNAGTTRHQWDMPLDDDESRFARLEEDEMDKLLDCFRKICHEEGVRQVCAQWVGSPLIDWLAGLDLGADGGEYTLDCLVVARLAVGINEVYAIRDALIMSMIVRPDRCPKSLIMDFVTRPHMPKVVGRMDELLNEAFDEGVDDKAERRCRAGISMLKAMIRAVPERFQVHPLAMVAYGLWWMGDDQAAIYALQALALDEDCSLAAIVLGAIDRGVSPSRYSESRRDSG